MGKPATGTDTITSDGTVVTRISLRNGVRISIPLFRGPEDPHLEWLKSQIVVYARALYTRATSPLTRQEIADELCDAAKRLRSVEDGRALRGAWERLIEQDLVTRNRDAKLKAAMGGTSPTVKDVMELWLTGEITRLHPAITLQKKAKHIRRWCERYILPEVGHFPVTEIRVHHFEQVFTSPLQKHLGQNSKVLTWKYMTQIMSLAETPLALIERRPNSAALKPDETERVNANLQPLDLEILMGCQAVSIHDRVFWGYLGQEGVRISEALDLRWLDLIILGASTPCVTHHLIKVDKRNTWVMADGMHTALMRYRELFRPGESDEARVFRPTFAHTDEAEKFRQHLKRAGITRAELFDHDPSRLQYRVRGHDLRGLFVTTSLAAGKPDSYVRDRTGHTSVAMIERYRGRSELLKATGQTTFVPLDIAIPELRARPVAALPISHVLPANQPPAAHLRLVSGT